MVTELLFVDIVESRSPRGYGGLFYGAWPAQVTDIKDPDGQGRVKVSLPWSPDGGGARYELWARLATMMAGNDRGSWFIPDPGDEVLVVFMGGDPSRPCVVGALWNGQDQPPQSMDGGGQNNIKKIKSRNGVQFTMDDTQGQETMILETPAGQKVTLKDGPGSIELQDSNGNTVTMDSSGITVDAAGSLTITASTAELTVSSLTVNSGSSVFSGQVQAASFLTTSIVSSSYTPGAGNML